MKKLFIGLLIIAMFFQIAQAQDNTGSATGRVYDKNGPLSNVEVLVKIQSKEEYIAVKSTRTDISGGFQFDGLSPNSTYLFEVHYNNSGAIEVLAIDTDPRTNQMLSFNLSGKISGKVLLYGKPLSAMRVNLTGQPGILLSKTYTDTNGSYEFNNVGINQSYYLATIYEEVEYGNSVIQQKPEEQADIEVYEAINSDETVAAEMDHVIITPSTNGIFIDEMMVVRNEGNKTFYAPDGEWVKLPAPRDRQQVESTAMECCVQQTQETININLMEALKPNELNQVIVSYLVPWENASYTFERKLPYKTKTFSLLILKSGGIDASTIEGFSSKEETVLDNKPYIVVTARDLMRNSTLKAEISGLTIALQSTSPESILIAIIAACGIAAVISYPYIKRRSAAIPSISRLEELEAEKRAIYSILDALETDLKKGAIPEDEYERLRVEYKQRGIEVIKRIEEAKANEIKKEEQKEEDKLDAEQALYEVINSIDDIETLERMLEKEKKGKRRATLIKLIEKRLKKLRKR